MGKAYVKQHIVPRSYLNRFGTARGKDEYEIGVCMPSISGDKYFLRNTSDVGYIKNYYDVSDKPDPHYWEHFLAHNVDTLCGAPLDSIISSIMLANSGYRLSDNAKRTLSTIMIYQIFRIPQSLDYFKSNIYPDALVQAKDDVIKKYCLQNNTFIKNKVNAYSVSDERKKELFLNLVFKNKNVDMFIDMLMRRAWLIYINACSSDYPYVTSDNPVLLESLSQIKLPGVFNNSFDSVDTCIYFPLSPSIAVVNYSNKGIFASVADQTDGRVFLIDDNEYVLRRNSVISSQAYKYVFLPKVMYEYCSQDDCGS